MNKLFAAGRIAFLLLCAGWICSCGGGARQKDAEGFPPAETLVADSVAINEILGVGRMVLCRDYAAIYSPKTSKVLFRYRLPDWAFVDSSLVAGQGPDDLSQAYLLMSDRPDNALWVSESTRQKISRYDLSEQVRKAVSIPGSDWIFDAQVCGDTLLLYGKFDFPEKQYLLRVAHLADSVRTMDNPVPCLVKSQMGGDGNSQWARMYNVPALRVRGDRLVLWYSMSGSLFLYRIEPGGSLRQEKSFGEPLTQEKVQDMDFDALSSTRTSVEELAAVSDRFIFMLRTQYDRSFGEMDGMEEDTRKVESLEVKVYDWEMNPVAKFRLDHPQASAGIIDVARNKVYAYDPRLDFEQVYVYDMKL